MKYSSGWKYDNNSAYYAFTPRDTDILVAAVDFSADTVTDLKGQSGTVYGITKGYADGNLTFYADKWNGSTNDGEFSISGDWFTTNARSTVTKSYFFGSQRVAMRQGSILTYLHGDHLGSASLSTDASGGKTADMRYYPYGERRSGGVFTDRRYTGQREEAGLGLYDYNARYYDPVLGRFIQADTIVPSPANPQSLNRYSYVLNSPLRYTDPSGHLSNDEVMDLFGTEMVPLLSVVETRGNHSCQ